MSFKKNRQSFRISRKFQSIEQLNQTKLNTIHQFPIKKNPFFAIPYPSSMVINDRKAYKNSNVNQQDTQMSTQNKIYGQQQNTQVQQNSCSYGSESEIQFQNRNLHHMQDIMKDVFIDQKKIERLIKPNQNILKQISGNSQKFTGQKITLKDPQKQGTHASSHHQFMAKNQYKIGIIVKNKYQNSCLSHSTVNLTQNILSQDYRCKSVLKNKYQKFQTFKNINKVKSDQNTFKNINKVKSDQNTETSSLRDLIRNRSGELQYQKAEQNFVNKFLHC